MTEAEYDDMVAEIYDSLPYEDLTNKEKVKAAMEKMGYDTEKLSSVMKSINNALNESKKLKESDEGYDDMVAEIYDSLPYEDLTNKEKVKAAMEKMGYDTEKLSPVMKTINNALNESKRMKEALGAPLDAIFFVDMISKASEDQRSEDPEMAQSLENLAQSVSSKYPNHKDISYYDVEPLIQPYIETTPDLEEEVKDIWNQHSRMQESVHNTKFFIDKDGKMEEVAIKDNSYFMSGYQNDSDKGVLSTAYFGEAGTTLTPVLTKEGNKIVIPEYAGKEVKELGGVATVINKIKDTGILKEEGGRRIKESPDDLIAPDEKELIHLVGWDVQGFKEMIEETGETMDIDEFGENEFIIAAEDGMRDAGLAAHMAINAYRLAKNPNIMQKFPKTTKAMMKFADTMSISQKLDESAKSMSAKKLKEAGELDYIDVPSGSQQTSKDELMAALNSRNYTEDLEKYKGDKIIDDSADAWYDDIEPMLLEGWQPDGFKFLGQNSNGDGDNPAAVFEVDGKLMMILEWHNAAFWVK